jgi:hypothetical protein
MDMIPADKAPSPLATVTVAIPVAVFAGIWQLICPGETKKSGAARSIPALSLTIKFVPAKTVGSGNSVAVRVSVASLTPKAAAMLSGATANGAYSSLKLLPRIAPDWKPGRWPHS